MKKPEQDLIYKVELLEGLIERQQGLIETSNRIIDMKTRLVELCEEETAIYRRENATLKVMCVGAFITVIAMCIVTLFCN